MILADAARTGFETTLGFPDIIDIYAQVVDASGSPVPNAHIMVKGTNIATTSDASGIFSLNDIVNLSTVVISSVQGGMVELPAHSIGNKVTLNSNTIPVTLDPVKPKKSNAGLYVIGGLVALTAIMLMTGKSTPRKLAL